MINYEYADLFNKDNVKKQLIIAVDDMQITNNRIYSEAFELSESLCSQSELRFGCCEASVLKLKIRNEFGELKGKWLDVSTVLDENIDIPFKYGKYKVYSDEPSGDKKYKNITAYDAMHGVINAEMVEWYDNLPFPITMREFRNSFFEYLGLSQVEIELVNDDMLIEKTIDADSIGGKEIITAICELNGVFGHINRQGLFDYISLAKRKQMIYPGMGIYPGSGIYPSMMFDTDYEKEDISKYISCEYEDFETQLISKLQIRQEENDIGAITGTGTNTYIVQDNFLVYGKSHNDIKTIANKLFSKINGVYYRPFKATLQGNPCIEVGDFVVFHTRYKEVEGYLLERNLKGIQALKDSFESKGVYEYAEKVNSVKRDVKRLKGKTAVLERTVEMLNSTIMDEETGLQTQIKQTSEQVEIMAGDDYVSSKISVELGKILLKGNRIAIESDYFSLSEDGKLHAREGVFEGDIVTYNAIIQGGDIQIKEDASGSYGLLRIYKDNWETRVASGVITTKADGGYIVLSGDGQIEVYEYASSPEKIFGLTGSACALNSEFVNVYHNLTVNGTKSRLTKTESYNNRLLYCYEMPSPIFGDVGHGVIGEDGLCYIDIDQVFFETIDTAQSYHVFLQSYSEDSVYVAEKQQGYFVVKGTPNTEFDWEIKAKQLDFPLERLEEKLPEDDYEETNYIALANTYLSEYEQEVLNYE